MPSELVALANCQVPMVLACRAVGMTVGEGSHSKLHCPWGEFTHPDGGDDPAFRVYSDHGFCFACYQWYSPVSLCVAAWEVSEDSAAEALLRAAGITPATYEELWEEAQQDKPVDAAALREALTTYCARNYSRWGSLQYHDEVSLYLARCLGWREKVRTESDARLWLERCSLVMDTVLRRADAKA